MMDHRAPAPQESVKMHHDRQRRHAVPIVGHQDIVAAVTELADGIPAAGREGLGGGGSQSRNAEENAEEGYKY